MNLKNALKNWPHFYTLVMANKTTTEQSTGALGCKDQDALRILDLPERVLQPGYSVH